MTNVKMHSRFCAVSSDVYGLTLRVCVWFVNSQHFLSKSVVSKVRCLATLFLYFQRFDISSKGLKLHDVSMQLTLNYSISI